jgi:DNA-directed RNA polymerase specialized sigma24 family protein
VDPYDGPERRMEEREDQERLIELMRDVLDPIEQEALWLRYGENASVDDITRSLDLKTVSGARGLMQTARRKLRAAARARGGDR